MKNLALGIALAASIFMGGCSKDGEMSSPDAINPGGQSGSMARFVLGGNTLYAIDQDNMKHFNVSNSKTPTLNGETFLINGLETAFIRDENTLFVGTQSGMYIFNISNPLQPQQLSFYEHITRCDPVVADNEYAYVTLRSASLCGGGLGGDQLQIIDISNLSAPRMVTSRAMSSPKGLAISADKKLFICDNGIKVYDVTNAQNPILVTHYTGLNPNDIILRNNLVMAVADDGLYQFTFQNNTFNLVSKLNGSF